MLKSHENSVAAWAFLIGVVLALAIGLFTTLLPIPALIRYSDESESEFCIRTRKDWIANPPSAHISGAVTKAVASMMAMGSLPPTPIVKLISLLPLSFLLLLSIESLP